MGMTAENVAERCHVTREQQDEWAVISQNRAVEARDSGHFDAEIVPVTVPAHTDTDKEGNEIERARDRRQPRRRPAPRNDDGGAGAAAAGVQARRDRHRRQRLPAQRRRRGGAGDVRREGGRAWGCKPLARIVASTVAAIRPEIMGLGPIPAIRALLEQTKMTIDDVDIVEINEAFAAQIVPCRDELGIPEEKLNPFGGAIALGHPFGMTGARIMTTLINGLRATRRDLRDRVDVRRRRDGPGDADRAPALTALAAWPASVGCVFDLN